MSDAEAESEERAGVEQAEAAENRPQPAHISTVLLWVAVVTIVGGFACGKALEYFSLIGGAGLLLLGLIAGLVGRKLLAVQSRGLAAMIALGSLLALPLALIYWVRASDRQAMAEGWLDAVELLPVVAVELPVFLAGTSVCAVCGAAAAYWQCRRQSG